ncbi:glycosyltransferase family 39 protein [Candidatus Bathyarchaeota archaeon]|nr:glycosyltransferase family 39 protein [Candidatus Bathyarchaeota archaeon]
MFILTAIFFSIAVYDLGYAKTPTSGWDSSSGGEVYFDLGSLRQVKALYVLLADAKPVIFEIFTNGSGSWVSQGVFHESYYYKWRKIDLTGVYTRFVKLHFYNSLGMIDEVYFVGKDGKKLHIEKVWAEGAVKNDVGKLIDEQEVIEHPPTYRSHTYFDEIYYVRTAEEYLNHEEPYEWTHPPLGKFFIALSILSLGFSPFGWRFAGVVVASLMIPTIYLLAKVIFHTRVAALLSSSLLSLDFMHFTMGRIATVDTFAVFFILTSYVFLFVCYRRVVEGAGLNGWLFLAGAIAFFLAFSTKWYALYGFAGEVVLISAALLWNVKASRCEFREIFRRSFMIIICSAAVAVSVYFCSFIPYMTLGHSLQDVINRQWEMYRYHSTLKATHPFSSPWWSWPLITRPLWLDVQYLPNGMVSTIVAMGNPGIWWMSLPFLTATAIKAIKDRDKTSLFIVSLFLFQWIPYAFISRCLFIYHFYMNVPVITLSITEFLNDSWGSRWGKAFTLTYLTLLGVLFALFYPVISGMRIPYGYKEALRWFGSWLF